MRILLAAFLLGGSSLAQEEPSNIPEATQVSPTTAPTFLGLYGWKQAIWQYTADADGQFAVEKGDVWGGRLVAGLGMGRFGMAFRADISGLKEQFSFEDPETYQTLEVFVASHVVVAASQGMQIGPVGVAGSVANEQSRGIAFNLYGGGIRIGGHGAEFHLLYGYHGYLPYGGWRVSASGHMPIYGRVYFVGDLVSGADGFARVGIGVRVK